MTELSPADKVADIARRAFAKLPPAVQERAREARTLVQREPVPPAPIDFPPDVADRDAVFAYLGSAHVFDDDSEAVGYLTDAIDRFRITMALLPELPPGARVLELGANPYFLTRLLRRRRLDVTCANYFGESYSGPMAQTIAAPDGDEVFEFAHFNIEQSRFPYEDDTFDLVLFCEILEHLPSDPIHTLAEIHRVAKPGATVVVTTPNAARLTNLVRIWRGENIYEDLSGHGTYGRHNREYTVAELDQLLTACGYRVDHVFAVDLHEHAETMPAGVGVELAHRGDNLFAVCSPQGEPRWAYPAWLYSSRHAIEKVVRPDFLAGHNDVVQATGFWDAEVMAGLDACWLGAAATATVTLAPEAAATTITVEGIAPPPAAGGALELTVTSGDQTASWTIAGDGSPFTVTAPFALPKGASEVTVTTDRQWSPQAMGMGADGRTLSVALHRIAAG